jgi:hypothetical protein
MFLFYYSTVSVYMCRSMNLLNVLELPTYMLIGHQADVYGGEES